MQTILMENGIQFGFEDILKGIQKLDNQSLVKFVENVNQLVSNRTVPSKEREQIIIKKIKNLVSASLKRRQKQLFVSLQDETISEKELEELKLLNSFLEEKSAERILLMGQLATLRGISLQQLIQEKNFKSA
jgi:hypothetical protein